MNLYRQISILFTLIFAILCIYANGQTTRTTLPVKFDPELARKLRADEYGMKTYVFAVLKSGDVRVQNKDEVNELQAGHLRNIVRLSEDRKLVLAGPFLKGGDSRGVYVFDVRTIEEAKNLVETDPAVMAGLFKFELYLWYASAALPEISNIHMKIQKKSIVE